MRNLGPFRSKQKNEIRGEDKIEGKGTRKEKSSNKKNEIRGEDEIEGKGTRKEESLKKT
jgi:hypothetical protein